MNKLLAPAILVCFILSSCSKVPVLGRNQLSLIPQSELIAESLVQYDSIIESSNIITGTPDAQLVQKVGNRLATATTNYLMNNGYKEMASQFKWEYHLIQSNEVNAWCMPGGKIAVYSGIMPITQDENGLAVVMGHEISHAVAKHGDERLSQMLAAQLGGMALDVALSQKPAQTRNIWETAYGLTANYAVLLPFSRQQEAEADKLGMIFMANAGYNPEAALAFWQRMMAKSNGASPPVFLSDHPSDQQRVNNIKKFMNTAMKYYKAP